MEVFDRVVRLGVRDLLDGEGGGGGLFTAISCSCRLARRMASAGTRSKSKYQPRAEESGDGDNSQQVSAILDEGGALRVPPGVGEEMGRFLVDLFNYHEAHRKRLEDELVASKARVEGLLSELADRDKQVIAQGDEIHKLKQELEGEEGLKVKMGAQQQSYSAVLKKVEGMDIIQAGKLKEVEVSLVKVMDEQKRVKEVETRELVRPRPKELKFMAEEGNRSRCVLVSGIKEPDMPTPTERRNHEKGVLRRIFDKLEDNSGGDLFSKIVETRRMGKYDPKAAKGRPLKVRFDWESAARETLANAWKLSSDEELKGFYIDRDLSLEERRAEYELRKKARAKNNALSTEEKTKHFFVVRGGKVVDLKELKGRAQRQAGRSLGEESAPV